MTYTNIRLRLHPAVILLQICCLSGVILLLGLLHHGTAFSNVAFSSSPTLSARPYRNGQSRLLPFSDSLSSQTQLNAWWFGGTSHPDDGREECELVAVRIERTSANSRRIWGEIEVPLAEAGLDDVWAILTDYDRLSEHVPNLVESRRVATSRSYAGDQGDGQYKCRLYQKGAQNIIGFEFGASVTMDMNERILKQGRDRSVDEGRDTRMLSDEEKEIGFKCVDSVFFTKFDGEWNVKEGMSDDGVTPVVKLRYLVDVQPKGPVPVTALEWRIREDVPTNLRAVKKAAIDVGSEGVMSYRRNNSALPLTRRNNSRDRVNRAVIDPTPRLERVKNLINETRSNLPARRQLAPVRVTNNSDWGDDETMAKYLRK